MIPYLSEGMGVESVAILLRWIFEPETRVMPDGAHFELEDLTVLTAQVGDEFRDTGMLFDTHIIPLMREHSIRFVQVARAGASQTDGYVVLEDSRQPTRTFLEGRYKLSDEMRSSGCVPQFAGGVHKCSLKFKAATLEAWLSDNAYGEIAQAFGYNFEELRRVQKSEKSIAKRNDKEWKKLSTYAQATAALAGHEVALGFGFNYDELKRVAKGMKHDHILRTGFYPLVDWKWTRNDCKAYIRAKLGVEFKKSACAFCPFSKVKPRLIERHKWHPDQSADAMLMEHVATAFNPRAGSLYKNTTLYDVVIKYENTEALALYEHRLAEMPWAVYRVRRIRKAGDGLNSKGEPRKGTTVRCVQIETTGTQDAVQTALRDVAARNDAEVTTDGRIPYVILSAFQGSEAGKEEFFTAAPALANEKVRSSFEQFDEEWDDDDEDGLMCGPDDMPLFTELVV